MTGGYYPDTKITDLQGDYLAINTDGSINVGVVASSATQAVNITQVGGVATGGSSLPINDAGGSVTVDGTVTANAGTGNFLSKSYTPAVADILCGGVTVTNSTTATVFLTIPANRTWYGNIGVNSLDTATAAVGFGTCVVTTTGANTTPVAGTILVKNTTHPGGTGSGGQSFSNIPFIWINTGASGATLTVTLSGAAATFTCNAFANGVLL